MDKIIILLAVFLLAGCGPVPKIAKGLTVAKSIGAQKISDAILERNESQLCKWPTIGSLERRYGNNPTKYKDYHKFCDHRAGQ